MENDLSNIQLRWHAQREEKMKTTSALEDVKRLEDDLEHLAKEKNQIDLEEKVVKFLKQIHAIVPSNLYMHSKEN